MREYGSFSEQFADLTDHFVEPGTDAGNRREYLELRKAAWKAVETDPAQASSVIEFIFRSSGEAGKVREAVGLLRHLVKVPGYEGRAFELLGLAMQNPTADIAEAAGQALRGAARRKTE